MFIHLLMERKLDYVLVFKVSEEQVRQQHDSLEIQIAVKINRIYTHTYIYVKYIRKIYVYKRVER